MDLKRCIECGMEFESGSVDELSGLLGCCSRKCERLHFELAPMTSEEEEEDRKLELLQGIEYQNEPDSPERFLKDFVTFYTGEEEGLIGALVRRASKLLGCDKD